MPTYSFELGKRVETRRPLRLDANDVLIIEGIHGLNPELTGTIDPRHLYKIYVSDLPHCALMTITGYRLPTTVCCGAWCVTINTGISGRGDAPQMAERAPWGGNVDFPFAENADATFNSSLILNWE